MEEVWKVTQKTISFYGKLLSFSMFSALPSVWSINLYLCRQFTLTLKICKSFCPAVSSILICNTVGRTYSKHCGHPISFKVCFTDSEHTACFSSEGSYKCVSYEAITVYFVLTNKNMMIKKKKSICNCFQLLPAEFSGKRKTEGFFSPLVLACLLFLNQAYFSNTALTGLYWLKDKLNKTQMDNTCFKSSLKLTKTIKGNVLRRNIFQRIFSQEYTTINLA